MLALLLCGSRAALAGEGGADPVAEAPPAWTVQIDPLTTALGYVHVQVERRVAPPISVYAGPHARLFRGIGSDEDEDQTGIGLELGVRWFFLARHQAPRGLWAQARGVLARVTKDEDVAPGGYASALVGYTYIAARRWVLSGGLGVQYIHYRAGGAGPEGVLPAAHTTIGLAF